jgi:DNA-binding NtrC family response regulator
MPDSSAGHMPGTITILSLSAVDSDHAVLAQTFRDSSLTLYPNCRLALRPSPTLESTIATLRRHRIPIVVCDRDGQPDAWRELLEVTRNLPAPPCLIVTSRNADDRLWAELLHHGVFDLISKPFDTSEVVRIVHSAWIHWQNRYGAATTGN